MNGMKLVNAANLFKVALMCQESHVIENKCYRGKNQKL